MSNPYASILLAYLATVMSHKMTVIRYHVSLMLV